MPLDSEISQHDLITSSRVTDTPVFNPAGDRIGRVEDLSIEKQSGRVRYALLSFGGFLGIGERIFPLPWAVLDYDTVRNGYIVPLSKEALQKAPSYTKDELEAFGGGDQDYRAELYSYYGPYGAVPYW